MKTRIQNARKEYVCDWCRSPIDRSTKYKKIYGTDKRVNRYHIECMGEKARVRVGSKTRELLFLIKEGPRFADELKMHQSSVRWAVRRLPTVRMFSRREKPGFTLIWIKGDEKRAVERLRNRYKEELPHATLREIISPILGRN